MAFSTVLYLNRSVILRAWSKPQVHPEPVVKEKKGKRKGKKTGKVESGVENRKVENGKGVESRKVVEKDRRVENGKKVENGKTEKLIKNKKSELDKAAIESVAEMIQNPIEPEPLVSSPTNLITERRNDRIIEEAVKSDTEKIEVETREKSLENGSQNQKELNVSSMENAAGMELLSNDTIAPIAPNVSDTPVMKMESTIPDTSMVRVAPDAPTAEFASSGVPPFKRSSTPSSTDSNQQVDHIHHSPSHSRGWQSDLSSQFPLHSPSFPSGRAQRRPHQHTPPPQPDVVPIVQKLPRFSNYGVTFSMCYKSTSPNDSVFVLLRSLPPQVDSQGAERVMVGNRSIFGWKLCEGERMTWSRELMIEVKNGVKRSISTPSLAAMRK